VKITISKPIVYRGGYKYQTAFDYVINLPIKPPEIINTYFLRMTLSGQLKIKRGYAWDGASGPTWDTKSVMRGSLVHDALYQLMRMKWLDKNYRKEADKILRVILIQDGAFRIRAWAWYAGVRIFAGKSSTPAVARKILTAP